MTRVGGPPQRSASASADDPLVEALRHVGAEILDEPIPDRLRQVLRRAQGDSQTQPDPTPGEHPRRIRRK